MKPAGIKVLELFGGIGACSKALERLGIDYEIVDYVEIDKYAVKSFNAIHGTNFEPQDITKWNKDIECDLIMHGSPCQDFSVAGRGAGGDEGSGTRSSLMYETLRIVEKLKPKYVIWENVKNLLSKKHRHNFEAYLEAMEKLGYINYYQVLNAKNYGIPQNRERVFTVSLREDIAKERYLRSAIAMAIFEFPEPMPLEKRLKDVLEKEVDEKYYLTDKTVAGYLRHTRRHEKRGNGFKFEPTNGDTVAHTVSTRAGGRPTDNFIKVAGRLDIKGQDQIKRVYDISGVSPTLSTMQGGNRQPKIVEDFYKSRKPRVYDETSPTLRSERTGLKVAEPSIVASRGRDPENPSDRTPGNPRLEQRLEPKFDGTTNTITTVQKDNYVATPYRIRKLTPKECWRLMGFDDTDFEKAEKVNSNTQLYKQAGNSIVVNVLEAILKKLLLSRDNV